MIVRCPSCRYSTGVNTRILASTRFGGEPIPKLLERGTFKCRRKRSSSACDGTKADGLDVSCMDVGMSKNVASWDVVWPQGHDAPGVARCKEVAKD